VITPLAAHSLAFRPIVLRDSSRLKIEMLRAHEGTSLVRDGRVFCTLDEGTIIEICRHDRKATFVINPAASYWRILQDKLRWAAPPMFRT
jgi:NAD kinase